MKTTKKELEVALEMACKKLWTGWEFSCDDIECKWSVEAEDCQVNKCNEALLAHFIKLAKGRKK